MSGWTPERDALLRSLREQGLTRPRVAARLRCSVKALEQRERRLAAAAAHPEGNAAWPVREALNVRRKALRMTWPEFCRAFHVALHEIHNWRRDRAPAADLLAAVQAFLAGARRTIGDVPALGAEVVVLVSRRPSVPGLLPVPAALEDAREWLYAELARRGLGHLEIEARWMALPPAETVARCNALRLEHGLPPYRVRDVAA